LSASPPGEAELQRVADRVNRHLGRAAAEVLAAGGELLRAKAKSYGDFGRLFQDHPQPVKNPVRFTRRLRREAHEDR
jgi:hypothetical protein